MLGTRWARHLDRIIREKGWHQGDLAKAAGLNRGSISRLLRQQTAKTDTLEAICRVLQIDISELFAPETPDLSVEQTRLLIGLAEAMRVGLMPTKSIGHLGGVSESPPPLTRRAKR